ncbi:hypothetical protein PGH12_01955 [Chryseobacterium wangxinyae]|uniref:hypothetical protein n=1 Tax=Chryseobacterium sp. CY350 TaxID=2997336 RepID=UPI00226FAD49|nr:hypothetical protein [Chryseobacterium sp. CY350]MCY0979291.1 hypothetical protein [Chryseobacterium sp. CY350]WBZ95923.1 hypothetical protein PGH12_01955 [Chryseobacterium sp. CY350]
MLTDETKPSDFKKSQQADYTHIKGWGIDADSKNDPTYPIKKRTNEEHEGYTWERPALQTQEVEILKSVERPNLTAVFGTASPPEGINGAIRKFAFRYSESSYGRWLPLVLADRVGAVEGIIEDLKKGYVPNIFAERGWGAEWKYNKKNFLLKIAVVGAVTAVAFTLISSKRKK